MKVGNQSKQSPRNPGGLTQPAATRPVAVPAKDDTWVLDLDRASRRKTARHTARCPDDADRALRFWQGLLQTTLDSRDPGQGRGWQVEREGIVFGLHERGGGPGDRFSLPYFPVSDLVAAVERVRELGGEIVHPGERWAICLDSEGTPFGLAGPL